MRSKAFTHIHTLTHTQRAFKKRGTLHTVDSIRKSNGFAQ